MVQPTVLGLQVSLTAEAEWGEDKRLHHSSLWLSALASSQFFEGESPACGLTSVSPHLLGDGFQQSLGPVLALIFPGDVKR